ncbi:MAG TPA: HI0074 family nucleotidyltransferase substrate-binding subunit [Polyangia bacterium]
MTTKALANAETALATLLAFLAEPVASERDRAGVIQAFEFTFEATWKLIKFVAEREGLPAESPRRALIAGYKLGLLQDETLWLDMLRDRNLTSHVYHHQIAERIFVAIQSRYAHALAEAVGRAHVTLAP